MRLAPVAISAALGTAMLYGGLSTTTSAAVATIGFVVSLAGCFLQPVPLLGPAGGHHHVGVRHLPGHRAAGMPAVTVFYPTNCPPLAPEPWLPHADVRYAEGMAKHAKVPAFVLVNQQSLVRTKVTRNASLLSLRLPTGGTRTLVVLCHGLAAHHQAYACAAMDLAARGAIVVCPQHGDGSASFCRDGEEPDMEVVMLKQLQPGEDEARLREQQLQTRVKECLRVIGAIETGSLLHKMFCTSGELQEFAACSAVRIVLAGHSFGAATALATAVRVVEMRNGGSSPSSSPSPSLADRLQISHVVCNDLWHLPLAPVLPLLRANNSRLAALMPPVLLQESVQWDRWAENKCFELELLTTLGPSVVQRMVMEHTDHLSFSDVGVLSPYISRKPYGRGSSRKKITAFASQILSFVATKEAAK